MSVRDVSFMGAHMAAQPDDVRSLFDEERDRLIISAIQVDGRWVVKSLYGDDCWELIGGPSNRSASYRLIEFTRTPEVFRSVAKEMIYRYHRGGRDGTVKPAPTTVISKFHQFLHFLQYLDSLKVKHLGAVTPMVCSNYVAACRAKRRPGKKYGKPISAGSLRGLLSAVEVLYALSQFTATPMPAHPWPESSAKHLAGLTGTHTSSRTPLMPDDVFTILFQNAYNVVQRGDAMLDLRDQLEEVATSHKGQRPTSISKAKNRHLKKQGWADGVSAYNEALNALRTACYIVVASLSGCRNHELAFVQKGACYSTEMKDGEVCWWMRSQSTKTGAGHTEWMIPEAAVEALRVMDRWAAPYQARIADEIATRRAADPLDPEIEHAKRHLEAVFLGGERSKGGQVRTLSLPAWNQNLKNFTRRCSLNWDLSSHHLRRKFANYAARSQFGDLRYLREHFKHWSQDMTNDAYALNESLEMELYAEIQEELDNIKLGLAEQWLNPAEPLAGGYGRNLADWRTRSENVTLFKDRAAMVRAIAESHAIRSNGHAWCTADDNKCIGNTFEKTRCSGCDNAVIGRCHARLYQQLYDDLEEVLKCDDIGPGGRSRLERDRARCREVLCSLGYDPDGRKTA